jgi:TolB protein
MVASVAAAGGGGSALIAALTAASPAGARLSGQIAFVENHDGFSSIYLKRLDRGVKQWIAGTRPRHTTASGATSPRWSSDGGLLVFSDTGSASSLDAHAEEIYLVRVDVRRFRRLTFNREPDTEPVIAPRSRRIAFVRVAGNRPRIWIMSPDGRDQHPLTQPNLDAFNPSWSPDGRQIAFTGSDREGRASIYVVSGMGGHATPITSGPLDAQPAWSPDGRHIAFVSGRDHYGETCFHDCGPAGELYVMAADGTQLHRVTRTRADDKDVAWTSDGAKLLFSSDRSDSAAHHYELYISNADGSCPTRLTHSAKETWVLQPAWRPPRRSGAPLSC